MKAGVGAKSQLSYAAMFMTYKQPWVTLWDQSCICSICKKIDAHIWQSFLTSNVATSDTEGEDFTSDLMFTPISPITTPAASVSALTPGPTVPAIPVLSPANTATTLDPNPSCPLFQPQLWSAAVEVPEPPNDIEMPPVVVIPHPLVVVAKEGRCYNPYNK
ncbi:hypothetical protein F4604DRAFT_1915288 [Suillus subluteus]|nr:hypothetical protein F4604DRAFT_1915288 [Suillus subluteus]